MDFETDRLLQFLAPQLREHGGKSELGDGLWLLLAVPAADTEEAELARAVLAGAPFPHHEGQSEDEAWTLHYVEEAHRREAAEWLEDLARTAAGEIRPANAAQRALIAEVAAGGKPHRAAQQLAEFHTQGAITAGLVRDSATVRALLDRLHQHEPLFFSAFLSLLNHHLIDLVVLLHRLIGEDLAALNDIVRGGLSADPFLQTRQDSAAEIRSALLRFQVINPIDQQKNTSIANPYAAYLEIVCTGDTVMVPVDGLAVAVTRQNYLRALRSLRRGLYRGEAWSSFDTQAPWLSRETAQPFRFLKQRVESRRDLTPLDALYMLERAVEA